MGLIGSFFGKDQRKDLAGAKAQSDEHLAKGYGNQRADYTTAEGYYQPYANVGQQGIEDQNAYRNILMNNGDAVDKFAAHPLFNGELAANQMATQRAGNAAGWGAGKEALAGQRVFAQTAGSWLDRYKDNALTGLNTGLQATNQMAGLRAQRGDNAMGYAATRAGNEINYGNALAANRGVGVNNLLKVGELGVSLATGGMKPKLG